MVEAGQPNDADHDINMAGDGLTDRAEELSDAIAASLQSHSLASATSSPHSLNQAARLAFCTEEARYSRFAGPFTPTSKLVTEGLQLVAADADAATRILEKSSEWLPFVAGTHPPVAWGLIDLIETALWGIEEREFSLLRAGRLLFISYMKSRHHYICPQYALELTLLLVPLHTPHVQLERVLVDVDVPLVVRLLLSIGIAGAKPHASMSHIEELYWSSSDYERLAANAVYGLREASLVRKLERLYTLVDTEPSSRGNLLYGISVCELVTLLLLSRLDPTRVVELGASVAQLHKLLALVTTECISIDGPALVLRNELGIVVSSAVWLLALQGLPPHLKNVGSAAHLGGESAVEILHAGTRVFKPDVCIGACLLLRSYARSVQTLRTEYIVRAERSDELCSSLKRLLLEEAQYGVDEAVAGLLCNLVIAFSPLREPLMNLGIIPALCTALQRNQSKVMLVNVLWALRNVCALREALEVEVLAFKSLNSVGLLRPLLQNDDREVTRLLCALIGNISPANVAELHGLLGGCKAVLRYLEQRMEFWHWPDVQEAASQALANVTVALSGGSLVNDPFSNELYRTMARCLQHSEPPPGLLVNIGHMIENVMLIYDMETPSSAVSKRRASDGAAMLRKMRGGLMLQEGVYDALKQIRCDKLSVRNSLVSARSAIEVTMVNV